MMNKPAGNFDFKIMSLVFSIRDFLYPRKNILREAGIKSGYKVLDYGCGPGGYIGAASELAGKSGKIFALDIHPLAIQLVKKIIEKKKLTNVEIIRSDCSTGLPDNSIDVVFLYDVFHGLNNSNDVLNELYRVLKPNGVLSFSDHHMNDDDIVNRITASRLFKLSRKNKITYSFVKD